MAGNLGQVPLAAHSVLQNVGFFMDLDSSWLEGVSPRLKMSKPGE